MNDSHTEILKRSAALAEVFTQEILDYLLSLIPTPARYSEIHERFVASYTDSLNGDPEKIKACEADRQVLIKNLAVMNLFVKAAAIKDPTIPDKLRIGRTAVRSPNNLTIGTPNDFKISFDRKTGELYASLAKVAGAKIYEIWFCDGDPSVEANWHMLETSSGCRRIPIKGLNRTKTNFIKVRGKSGNIVGPWSPCQCIKPA